MIETVAILFISNYIDYIFQDKNRRNCEFLLKELTDLTYKVEKVSILKDDVFCLTSELFTVSRQYDVVIVIGDTFRSNTAYKALINISSCGLRKENVVNGNDQRKAILPSLAKILSYDNSSSQSSVVFWHRMFVLDEGNVEKLYFGILKAHLEQYRARPKFSKSFILNGKEMLPNLQLGDFKGLDNVVIEKDVNNDGLKVSLEGSSFCEFVEQEDILRKQLHGISRICDNSKVLHSIYNSKEKHIRQAIENIEKCFETYGTENVFLSFNGGKDCTVLLHLIYTVLQIRYPEKNTPIFCMYVRGKQTFEEQDEFVSKCQIYYNLEVENLSSNIKEALEEVLSKKPNLEGCFLGTRRTDPYSGNLNVFQLTDPTWPKVMRVSPLLDWHYSDIWDYLLFYKVPYCKLYDMGYTSLGNVTNTIKNPGLAFYDAIEGKDLFFPAYKLLNEAGERNGRNVLK